METVEREASAAGFVVRGATFSPITGPEGNIEFWLRLARSGEAVCVDNAGLVREAHESLQGR